MLGVRATNFLGTKTAGHHPLWVEIAERWGAQIKNNIDLPPWHGAWWADGDRDAGHLFLLFVVSTYYFHRFFCGEVD